MAAASRPLVHLIFRTARPTRKYLRLAIERPATRSQGDRATLADLSVAQEVSREPRQRLERGDITAEMDYTNTTAEAAAQFNRRSPPPMADVWIQINPPRPRLVAGKVVVRVWGASGAATLTTEARRVTHRPQHHSPFCTNVPDHSVDLGSACGFEMYDCRLFDV